VLRRRVQRLGSRRWNAESFCTKDRVLKIELQKKMNAVRFCTKEEEVLKIESFRRRWNAVRFCTKDGTSKIELQNTVRFCTQ
jgi:hypothetical protein